MPLAASGTLLLVATGGVLAAIEAALRRWSLPPLVGAHAAECGGLDFYPPELAGLHLGGGGEAGSHAAADALAGDAAKPAVRTWVAQGTGDEICPEVFAQQLVEGLAAAGVPHTAYFLDAGHSAKSDGMSKMLRKCVDEFVAGGRMAWEGEEK